MSTPPTLHRSVLLLFGLSASIQAIADSPTILETIQVTSASASGAATDKTLAPASIDIVTNEELERGAFRDISQVLQSIPGITVDLGPSSKGGVGEISIRGMDSKYTLIMVDGIPQGSKQAYYNGNGSGSELGWLPPVSNIERIEVIKGPMSSLYGSDALGGVINIITKPVSVETTGQLSLNTVIPESSESGSQKQAQLRVNGALSEQLIGTLSAETYLRDEDKREGGYIEHKRHKISGKVDWQISANQKASLELGTAQQNSEGTESNTGSDRTLETKRQHQTLTHSIDWGTNTTNSYIKHEKLTNDTQNSAYDRITGNSINTFTLEDHLLSLGINLRRQSTENPSRAKQKGDLERFDSAIFAEDEWFMTDTFSLTTGARWVYDENYGSEFVPRLYGVYTPNDTWVFKGGVSAGYRTPDLKQGDSNWLEGGGGRSTDGADMGNDDLKPESSVSMELASIWLDNQGNSIGVTAFFTDYTDKIEKPKICDRREGSDLGDVSCNYFGYDYEAVWQYQNVDSAEVYGIEVDATWQMTDQLVSTFGFTQTDSEITSGEDKGEPLSSRPERTASIKLDWQASDDVSLWTTANYRGQYGTDEERPGFSQIDTGLVYQYSDSLSFYATIYNAVDKTIEDETYGTLLDGRRYNLGLSAYF